ncbi:MAG TPA: nucleoside triphosphate pyrophosphatase [Sphingomicrobium sp.]|nr:nucleoside triphosphate pyrophosphatase [Sphingomicrobium sp.]
MPLILASSSAIRKKMLDDAGIAFSVQPADVDEAAEKKRQSRAEPLAAELARAKALTVSGKARGDWVIGSDSVVSVDGRLFDKPGSRAEAAEHLRFFSGKTLLLTSAVALARSGEIDWSFTDTASLRVRELSVKFIEHYLDAEWPDVGYCVGVFRLEGRGVQLFSAIEGSHFTVMGMPLLPLLAALRERKILEA